MASPNAPKPLSIQGIGDVLSKIKVEQSSDYEKEGRAGFLETAEKEVSLIMVIEKLRALEAPITISQLGKIIGMDAGTIKLRISTGKFPTKPLIIVGPDIRIDPQILADELEAGQTAVAQ